MTGNRLEQDVTNWSVPEFHFIVEISDVGKIFCEEVSGLDSGFDVIEYHPGDMPRFTKSGMLGLRKGGDVTLKKAIFRYDKKLLDWFRLVTMNMIKRATVTVVLVDENNNPVQGWKLINAWPKKNTGENSNTDSNIVAMETIVLAHEGVILA